MSSCGSNNNNPVIEKSITDTKNLVKHKAESPIVITETEVDGQKVLTWKYVPYKAPTLSLSASPNVIETGNSVSVTYSAEVTRNFEASDGVIDTASLLKDGVDTGKTVSELLSGTTISHTVNADPANIDNPVIKLTANDASGNGPFEKTLQVTLVKKAYLGYSTSESVSSVADITILDEILTGDFKGDRIINLPDDGTNYYIWILTPSSPINGSAVSYSTITLDFPAVINSEGQFTENNDYGVSITYDTYRTGASFGATQLDVTLS